jgi:plasmid stabilization system protein ParE
MSFPVIYSERASETYDAISEQIEQRWGMNHVHKFDHRILEVIAAIKESPFIFQAIENNTNVRKAFIHKNCSVFYEVHPTRIEVLFFWDNRQDPIFL